MSYQLEYMYVYHNTNKITVVIEKDDKRDLCQKGYFFVFSENSYFKELLKTNNFFITDTPNGYYVLDQDGNAIDLDKEQREFVDKIDTAINNLYSSYLAQWP
jgi:DNA-binding beta-propeller fold protein YncE